MTISPCKYLQTKAWRLHSQNTDCRSAYTRPTAKHPDRGDLRRGGKFRTMQHIWTGNPLKQHQLLWCDRVNEQKRHGWLKNRASIFTDAEPSYITHRKNPYTCQGNELIIRQKEIQFINIEKKKYSISIATQEIQIKYNQLRFLPSGV